MSTELNRALLRDHAEAKRIDRGWRKLSSSLATRPTAAGRRGSRTKSRRLVLAALAAGFALGATFGVYGGDVIGVPDATVAVTAADDALPDVYAAGGTARRFVLPGGAALELGPESIVDTVQSGAGVLVLRLVRGEALVASSAAVPNGVDGRVALQVGGAEIVTAGGSMRVRLVGDIAELEVLSGSADVTAPDERGLLRSVVAGGSRARVPVRVRTASRSPLLERTPSDRERTPSVVPGPWELSAENEQPPLEPAPVAVLPDALALIEAGEYDQAAELLTKQYGSLSAAAQQVSDPAVLQAISTKAAESDDDDTAIAILERVLRDHGAKAPSAASDLARLYEKKGELAKAREYRRRFQEMSKLLNAETLCENIEAAAQAARDDEVLRLSRQYREQFLDGGPCTDRIDQLVGAIQKKATARLGSATPGSIRPEPSAERREDDRAKPAPEQPDVYE